jgi:lipopolysaccharide export LptBFGC system permease protein LptF
MSNDKKFIDGLIFKAPHENAPDYVIAKISIKRSELIAWLQSQDGDWVNADLKKSQQGKFYAAVDDWKPGSAKRQESTTRRDATPPAADEDIPF